MNVGEVRFRFLAAQSAFIVAAGILCAWLFIYGGDEFYAELGIDFDAPLDLSPRSAFGVIVVLVTLVATFRVALFIFIGAYAIILRLLELLTPQEAWEVAIHFQCPPQFHNDARRLVTMPTVPYRKSVWQRIALVGVLFLGVTLVGKFLYPVNSSLLNVGIFFAIVVIFTALTIAGMRKVQESVACPNCKANLFAVIEMARQYHLEFRHCPSCGERIEV